MDRLPHLTAALLLAACADTAPPATAPSGRRVDAVAAAPKAPVDLDDFCEVRPDPATAPTLTWPELAGPPAAPPAGPGWTWVNVWATWCGPCIEELPRILRWPDKLAAKGADLRIVLLTVDDSQAKVDAFRAGHAWLPDSLRTSSPDVLPAWLSDLGLPLPSVLPLHLWLDPQGKVRCARSGAVSADALDAVQALVAGG